MGISLPIKTNVIKRHTIQKNVFLLKTEYLVNCPMLRILDKYLFSIFHILLVDLGKIAAFSEVWKRKWCKLSYLSETSYLTYTEKMLCFWNLFVCLHIIAVGCRQYRMAFKNSFQRNLKSQPHLSANKTYHSMGLYPCNSSFLRIGGKK